MAQYRIFKHPVGKIEAVKQGWSWPAMFFTFIWAFVKGLWQVGASVLVLAMLMGLFLNEWVDLSLANTIANIVGIIIALVLGVRGNIWREQNLLSRGFEHVDSIRAPNPELAIASYLSPQPSSGDSDEPPSVS